MASIDVANATSKYPAEPNVARAKSTKRKSKWRRRIGRGIRLGLIVLTLLFSIGLIGRNNYQPHELQNLSIAQKFRGWNFDLLGWEVNALGDKAGVIFQQPAADLSAEEQVTLVHQYLDRAGEIARLEAERNRLAVADASESPGSQSQPSNSNGAGDLQAQIDDLRQAQNQHRLTVEQVIQQQVGHALLNEGFGVGNQLVPPVLFSFTEPPKKLVVSPRDKIETRYAQMLDAAIDLETIAANESQIYEEQALSAYVTNIGGLGAFPTMVVDRASLGWILSTVAHEWVHNYLTLFPLGINYATSHELTIINETVADIVGEEIGHQVAETFYPESLAPPPEPVEDDGDDGDERDEGGGETLAVATPTPEPPPFSFREEMRKTRLEVDRLLTDGLVDEAEAYMEARRLAFVENGYNLRVLNQAYFAFHGSYGTSAASTSTIGPKLQTLREQSGDLKTFLQTVRWMTSEAEIDEALAEVE